MNKKLDTPSDVNNAASEVLAIFQNLSAVKGKQYSAVVRVIFGLFNFHSAIADVESALPAPLQEAFRMMLNAHAITLNDATKTIVSLHLKKTEEESTDAFNDRCHAFVIAMGDDIKMLDIKQREYGASIFPTGQAFEEGEE